MVGAPASRVGKSVRRFGRAPRLNFSRIKAEERLAGLVKKHLALHFQNQTPRDGVAQLPWVRKAGRLAGAETLQGHVGSTAFLGDDIGIFLGWSSSSVRRLVDMLKNHELDESGDKGDVSLWSMEEKLSPDWTPLTRDEWYSRRWTGYFEDGGREVVCEFLKAYFVDRKESDYVLRLCDEFYEARTPIARLANQIDNFQGVMEAGARFRSIERRVRRSSKDVDNARWNFYNYLAQSKEIMEHPTMILALAILEQEVTG